MTYRRPSENGPFTSRWRLHNRARLLAVGFPASVVESDRTLNYVLLHGDDELGSGWTPKWLSEGQAQDMLRFLTDNIPNETGLEIFGAIRRRLAAETSSQLEERYAPEARPRFPTRASRKKLSTLLSLPDDPYSQDWDIEVADGDRVDEFLSAYRGEDLDDDDRFLLMAIIVASLNERKAAGREIGDLWPGVAALLRRDASLHASTIAYWCCGSDPDPEHHFAVTPELRRLWRDVNHRSPE